MKKIILTILALLWMVGSAWGATYGGDTYTEVFYISVNGSDTPADPEAIGTPGSPTWLNTAGNWANATDANDGKIGANDCVVLLDDGGDYTAMIILRAGGSSGKPIMFTGEIGGGTAIDGADAIAQCISTNSKHYIAFKNMILKAGADQYFYCFQSHDVSLDNVDFINDMEDVCNGHGFRSYSYSGLYVYNISITNCIFTAIYAKDAIRFDTFWGTEVADSGWTYNITVDGCTINGNAGDTDYGINIWLESEETIVLNEIASYGVTFTDNVISETSVCAIRTFLTDDAGHTANLIARNTITNVGYGDGAATNGLQLHHSRNLTVENNVINGVGCSTGDGYGIILDYVASDHSYYSDGTIVRYNTISNCDCDTYSGGISLWSAKNSQVYGNVVFDSPMGIANQNAASELNNIYNNTLVNNTWGGRSSLAAGSSTWKNNIFYGGTNGLVVVNAGSSIPTETNNCFYGSSGEGYYNAITEQPIAKDATDVITDPLFVSTTDFHLKAGSPCIWAGTDLSIATDLDSQLHLSEPTSLRATARAARTQQWG